MDNDLYTLVLQFDPKDKTTYRKVFYSLSLLDPNITPRLDELLASGKLIIKRDADLATARRILHRMRNTGANCGLKKQPTRPVTATSSALQAQISVDPNNSEPSIIRCPNCNHKQPPTQECRACGIIIAKARPRLQAEKKKKTPLVNEAEDVKENSSPLHAKATIANIRRQVIPSIWAWLKAQPIRAVKLPSWSQNLGDALLRCGVVFVIALIFEIGLLYLGRYLWYIYLWTTVGQYYVKHFPDKAKAIQSLVQTDALMLGWEVTVLTLYICFLLGCVTRILHLIRYLYDSQGILGKLIIWFIPTVALTAWALILQDQVTDYAAACVLAIVPTTCILSSCLHLAKAMLPELNGIIKMITNSLVSRKHAFNLAGAKFKAWLDDAKGSEKTTVHKKPLIYKSADMNSDEKPK